MNGPIRMLIAHFQSDIVSGAERSIADFVQKVGKRFECTMLIPEKGNLSDFYESKSYKIWLRTIQTKRRRYPGLHTIQSLRFAKELKAKEIDLILSNTFPAASRVGTACRIAEIPHGIYMREYISENVNNKKILATADRILTVSEDVRKYLCAFTNPDKVVVAYNHINAVPIFERVNTHKISRIRLLPFRENHPVVGIVGRIARNKQQDLFVKSIPYVLSEVPEARFVVVGAASNKEKGYENYLKGLSSELGVNDKVAFLGYRNDALEIISELTVSCVTSAREPLGRVILESQLIGCPVVASNTGGSPEIITDGETGILFSFEDTSVEERLATKIVQLLKDRDLRNTVIAKAMKHVQIRFTELQHVHQIEKYLGDLTNRN